MPTVLRVHGFRFFFFEQAERYAKFWLTPVALAESRGFRSSELQEPYHLVEQHREVFIIAWNEHFSQ